MATERNIRRRRKSDKPRQVETPKRTLKNVEGRDDLYATLSNERIAGGDLANLGPNALHLRVLIELLSVAQFLGRRTLPVVSAYWILRRLKVPTNDSDYYNTLEEILGFWSAVLSYEKVEGGFFKVRFARDFFKEQEAQKGVRWSKIYPKHIRFKQPQPILLHMILCAFSDPRERRPVSLRWGLDAWRRKLGVRDRNTSPSRLVPRISRWVEMISEETGRLLITTWRNKMLEIREFLVQDEAEQPAEKQAPRREKREKERELVVEEADEDEVVWTEDEDNGDDDGREPVDYPGRKPVWDWE